MLTFIQGDDFLKKFFDLSWLAEGRIYASYRDSLSPETCFSTNMMLRRKESGQKDQIQENHNVVRERPQTDGTPRLIHGGWS